MFCNEPVFNVYEGNSKISETDAFLDCFHDNTISLYLTEGYRIVLETEHYFISLGFNGVKLDKKRCGADDYAENGEWFDTFSPMDYEHTLFAGERLTEVKKEGNKYIAVFDDFSVTVIPHLSAAEINGFYTENYLHVFGCEHLLNRKCQCGGTGELLLDFVSDYVVRCNKCHISTDAKQSATQAIDSWNKAVTGCDLAEIEID